MAPHTYKPICMQRSGPRYMLCMRGRESCAVSLWGAHTHKPLCMQIGLPGIYCVCASEDRRSVAIPDIMVCVRRQAGEVYVVYVRAGS